MQYDDVKCLSTTVHELDFTVSAVNTIKIDASLIVETGTKSLIIIKNLEVSKMERLLMLIFCITLYAWCIFDLYVYNIGYLKGHRRRMYMRLGGTNHIY